jgi:hypothetical protein
VALPQALMRKQPGARLAAVGLRALAHRMALLALPTREQQFGLPTAALVTFAESASEASLRESYGLPSYPWYLLSNPSGPAPGSRFGHDPVDQHLPLPSPIESSSDSEEP